MKPFSRWAALAAVLSLPCALPARGAPHTGTVDIHLLALNDFHGHLVSGQSVRLGEQRKTAPGAAALAALLRQRKAARPNTLVVHAGDMVGASPPVSALFQDEPTVEFLNMAGWDVGALGNHEFDEGVTEMRRLLNGGPHRASRYYPRPFPGARFPVACSNVVDARTGQSVLPPYVVKTVGGVRVGFIGAVTGDLPTLVSAHGLTGYRVVEPAAAINRWSAHLRRYGVRAQVALIHEGGRQNPDDAPGGTLAGPIADIARRLDADVDILVSAHSHQYHNTFLGRRLVTQALWAGAAMAEIDVTVDRASGDIVRKRARIVAADPDSLAPAADVDRMVRAYERLAAPRLNRVVGETGAEMMKPERHDGEYALGSFIADAQRAAVNADIAFMNVGGIRSGLPAGPVTWGQAYSVQPFGNQVMLLRMTGAQIRRALEQQWGPGSGGQPREDVLQVSGLTYAYNPAAPYGRRVVDVMGPDNRPLDNARTYRVAVNAFLAGGGDQFSVFRDVKDQTPGPDDLEALLRYMRANPRVVPSSGRIRAAR